MLRKNRAPLLLFWLGTLMILSGIQAQAQDEFPTKPVEIVVPWPAGAPGDLATRILADKWGEFLGQPAIVVNKGGAGGAIGSRFVARAKPDGYTLLSTGDSQLLIARLKREKDDAGYDLDSFRLLFNFSHLISFITVKSDSRWKNFADFLAEAKKSPAQLQYSTAGGANQYLVAEPFFKTAGIQLTPVVFKSSPEALTALAGGHVDLTIANGLGGMGKSGLIRPLATSADSRLQDYPNVPTFKELGFPLEYSRADLGIATPIKTPERVVSKLTESFKKAWAKYEKEMGDKLLKLEQIPINVDGKTGMQAYKEKEKILIRAGIKPGS